MTAYVGRFAPSPTGKLHLGSLFGALVSYLDAKAHGGQWLVRIEDLDPPREEPGAARNILDTLISHGLEPDGNEVLFQSHCAIRYERRLEQLYRQGHMYSCPCSRKQLAALGDHTELCKSKQLNAKETELGEAGRLKASNQQYAWQDIFHGSQSAPIVDDFVLKRRDGLYAYQLAVVCDDIEQNITHVIRGLDLLESTPVQLSLYEAFNVEPPKFGHFALVQNAQGQKLSKQNLSPAIKSCDALQNLLSVMELIGFTDIPVFNSLKSALDWSIEHWERDLQRGVKALSANE